MKRRQAVEYVRNAVGRDRVSERRACRVLGQPRSTQRRQAHVPDDEPRLVRDMSRLATQYGRYGYRRITALLQREGWHVNHKRVERLWRREGLKVPQKQPKRRRLWLNDGSCVRLRPAYRDHVGSYDFVADRTSDDRAFRMLTIVDEHLALLAESLSAIPHIRWLRVHTRLPVMIPQRVTDQLLRWLTGTRLTPVVVIHVNHAAEVDASVAAALAQLVDAGVIVLNQAVLLKGINDDLLDHSVKSCFVSRGEFCSFVGSVCDLRGRVDE